MPQDTDFYDAIAGDYDAITGSGDRAAQAEGFVRELVSRHNVRSALDAACGTGAYAIPLARMGIRTVGADLSAGMLAQARRHGLQAGVSIEWVRAAMQELAWKVDGHFDAVLCMGNSIPHLLTDTDLEATLGGIAALLNPGGVVVLQLLNYSRLLARGERIVGVIRASDREYVRFYDFFDDRLRFNILEIIWRGDQGDCRIHSTMLRPYAPDGLRQALVRNGLTSVEVFSGLRFEPFDQTRAETVMLLGSKGVRG
jgi:SAM-dependent methyltransferase